MDDHAHVFDLTPEMALHGFDATQWDVAMEAKVDALNHILVPHPQR